MSRLEPDRELTHLLKQTLTGAWSSETHEPGKIYISALGGCLYHDVYLSAMQQDEEWNNGDMPAFLGEAFEQLIIKNLSAGAWPGFTVIPPPEGESQHRVTGESYGLPRLSGKLDGLLDEFIPMTATAGSTSRIVPLEIKLMSPWRFRDLICGHLVKGKPTTPPGLQVEFPNYYMQVQMYMGLLHTTECIFLAGASYRQPIVDYLEEGREYIVQRIPFDEAEFHRGLERAEYITDCLETGKEPHCEKRKYCG